MCSSQWDAIPVDQGGPHPGLNLLVVGGLRTNVENRLRVAVPNPLVPGTNLHEGAVPQTFTELYPKPERPWTVNEAETQATEPQTGRINWIRVFRPLMSGTGKICVRTL